MEKLSEAKTAVAAERAVDLVAAEAHIEGFLRALGHASDTDPELANTARLVATAFHTELLSGYRMRPEQILSETLAADGGDMIVVRDLDVTCVCPHHLLPASGVVHIGYVPSGKIVGFGALARLAECFGRRLTLQETFCEQVAQALVTHLGARGAGCVADLVPTCLTARGQRPAHARVTSVATAGLLKDDPTFRRELFALAGVQKDAAR